MFLCTVAHTFGLHYPLVLCQVLKRERQYASVQSCHHGTLRFTLLRPNHAVPSPRPHIRCPNQAVGQQLHRPPRASRGPYETVPEPAQHRAAPARRSRAAPALSRHPIPRQRPARIPTATCARHLLSAGYLRFTGSPALHCSLVLIGTRDVSSTPTTHAPLLVAQSAELQLLIVA